jgi:hypothetical protein
MDSARKHAPKLARPATGQRKSLRPGGQTGRKSAAGSSGQADDVADPYKEASEELNSHDMAAFFLAPYKAQVDAMQAALGRQPSDVRSKMDNVRIDLVQQHLTKKRHEVRKRACARTAYDEETCQLTFI